MGRRGLELEAAAVRGSEVWFSFDDVCAARASATDYLALADRFTTWVVTDVPRLRDADPEARARFSILVDILADRGVRLVATSAERLEDVLDLSGAEGLVPPDLMRTRSRLSLIARPSAVQGHGQ